ncbi:MAG: helix-turn-helix transcriptional regulator [Solirubrobacterales bacterium]|nr:helix-turn-helix transcriptional regulator [Solirubrobacterales bacterium]
MACGDEGIAILEEAATCLRSSPARLELARALCDLGAAQRRAGKRSAARRQLREAAALAAQCGALALGERIDDEVAATGLHLRREGASGLEALTPAERRVADLAASGLTNRAIAQTLFISVKTVGTHLGHIYEKLDLQGAQARDQLGIRLNGTLATDGAGTLNGAQRG